MGVMPTTYVVYNCLNKKTYLKKVTNMGNTIRIKDLRNGNTREMTTEQAKAYLNDCIKELQIKAENALTSKAKGRYEYQIKGLVDLKLALEIM